MNLDIIYLKDQTFIPDFLRVSAPPGDDDGSGATVTFCNDESDNTSYVLRCKRKFDTSDVSINAGESIKMTFPTNGRFEITNPYNGLMKCIVEVVEYESDPKQVFKFSSKKRVALINQEFLPSLSPVKDNDFNDGSDNDDSFESSSEEGGDDRPHEGQGDWQGVTYYLNQSKNSLSPPSLNDLFEHEDMTGLLSESEEHRAMKESVLEDVNSILEGHKSTGGRSSLHLSKKIYPKRKTIRYNSRRRSSSMSSSEDGQSDATQSTDNDDFYTQRARIRQASESQTTQYEIEARQMKAQYNLHGCDSSDGSSSEERGTSINSRSVFTTMAEPASCTTTSTSISASDVFQEQKSPRRKQRFALPPQSDSTSLHYATFTSQTSPARKHMESQAYASFLNPFESNASATSRRTGTTPGIQRSTSGSKLHTFASTLPNNNSSMGKNRYRNRRNKKINYDIVNNQLYPPPIPKHVSGQTSQLHIPDIEVVVISDYDFSRRNIVIHVNTPVEFRLHPHDVPLHVEHVLEGRSMQEELCFVSPILQHPYSRVFRVVPLCPGEIYVRCQIYTDMSCRIVILPSYQGSGLLPGFSSSSTSTTAAMLSKASNASSPQRYKGQVTNSTIILPIKSTCTQTKDRLSRLDSGANGGTKSIVLDSSRYPPLSTSFHGVAEVLTNTPMYSPHASSIGSVGGDMSDSQSCHSFSTAIDSDDGTIITRSVGSAPSTPGRYAHVDENDKRFPLDPVTPPRGGKPSLNWDDIESGDDHYPQHYKVPWHSSLASPMNKSSPSRSGFGKGEGFAYFDAEDEDVSSGGNSSGLVPTDERDSIGASETVMVEDFRFQPTHLTIEQGCAIRFVSVSHASVHKLSCCSSSSNSCNNTQISPEKNLAVGIPEFENRTLESDSSNSNEFVHTFQSLGTFIVVNEIFSFMSCEITVVVRAVPDDFAAEKNKESQLLLLKNERKNDSHVNDALYYLAHNNFDGYSNNSDDTCPMQSPGDKLRIYSMSDANENVSSDSDVNSFASTSSSSTNNVENESSAFNSKTVTPSGDDSDNGKYKQSVMPGQKSKIGKRSIPHRNGGILSQTNRPPEMVAGSIELELEKEKQLFYAHVEGRSHQSGDRSQQLLSTPVSTDKNLTTSESITASPLAVQIPMLGSFVSSPGAVSAAIAAAGIKQLLSSSASPSKGLLINQISPPKAQQKTIAAGADLAEEFGDSDSECDSDEIDLNHDLREIELKLLELDRARERTRIIDSDATLAPTVTALIAEESKDVSTSMHIAAEEPQLPQNCSVSKVLPSGLEKSKVDDEFADESLSNSSKVMSEKALQRRRLKNQRKKKNARLRSQSQDIDEDDADGDVCTSEQNVSCDQDDFPTKTHEECPQQEHTPELTGSVIATEDSENKVKTPNREEGVFWEEYRPPVDEEFVVYKKKSAKREKKQHSLVEHNDYRQRMLLDEERDVTLREEKMKEQLKLQNDKADAARKLKERGEKLQQEKTRTKELHDEKLRREQQSEREKETPRPPKDIPLKQKQHVQKEHQSVTIPDRNDATCKMLSKSTKDSRLEHKAGNSLRNGSEPVGAEPKLQTRQKMKEQKQVSKAKCKRGLDTGGALTPVLIPIPDKISEIPLIQQSPVGPAVENMSNGQIEAVHLNENQAVSKSQKNTPDRAKIMSLNQSQTGTKPDVDSQNRLMQLLHDAALAHGTIEPAQHGDPIIKSTSKSKLKSKRYQSYDGDPASKKTEQDIESFFSQRMDILHSLVAQKGKDCLPSGREVPVVQFTKL